MTEDVKVTRLSKAAREFNVGISTIIEFLHKKGFNLDPNPNTKLPPEAYMLLVKEYSTDISVKKESERLILRDLNRNKETLSIDDVADKTPAEEPEKEEEVIVKDSSVIKKGVDIKTEITKPDIKLVGKIDLDKSAKPAGEKKTRPLDESKEKAEVSEGKEKEKKEEKEKSKETAEVEDKKSAIDLHIVGKIDLDSDKKDAKKTDTEEVLKEEKKEKEPEEKEKKVTKKKVQEKAVEPKPEQTEKQEKADEKEAKAPDQEAVPPELYRTETRKLSGPTVVGKIDLPPEEKKKQPSAQPVKINTDPEYRKKKKRKRITKEKDQASVVKPDSSDKKDKTGKRSSKKRPVRAEVDEEDVQKQIKETLA